MWPSRFKPLFGNTGPTGIEQVAPTVVAATTTSSAATALPGNPLGDAYNPDILIENNTAGIAFCNFGDAAIGAATINNGIAVPPTSTKIVRVADTTGYVRVILDVNTTAGPVRFTRGAGM